MEAKTCEEARNVLWLLAGTLYYAGEKLAARAILEAARLKRKEDVYLIRTMLRDIEIELPYDELREIFGEGVNALAEAIQRCVPEEGE